MATIRAENHFMAWLLGEMKKAGKQTTSFRRPEHDSRSRVREQGELGRRKSVAFREYFRRVRGIDFGTGPSRPILLFLPRTDRSNFLWRRLIMRNFSIATLLAALVLAFAGLSPAEAKTLKRYRKNAQRTPN